MGGAFYADHGDTQAMDAIRDAGRECTEPLGPEYNCDEESSLTTGEDVRVCIDGR